MTAAGPSKREEDDEWSNLLHVLTPNHKDKVADQKKHEETSLSSLLTESEKEAPKRRYYYELDMKYNIDTFFYCTSTPAFFKESIDDVIDLKARSTFANDALLSLRYLERLSSCNDGLVVLHGQSVVGS